MATRQQQEQEPQIARLPPDHCPHLEQQIRGEMELLQQELKEQSREFSQEQVIGVEDYEEEEEEESPEQERDSIMDEQVETREEQEEAFPVRTTPQAENSAVHLHFQMERQHPASSGHCTKDPELLSMPSVSAVPSNADLFSSMDVTGSFASFPSKQVEGALQSCLTSAEGQVTRLLQQAMDTVQSQVLRALHQAANDIIEHLGKEAAHRVVVAERKSALLELELSSVKQQALSMLLRLKADSDTQALDADKKYLLEKRRAQDAEAKLAIAQDLSKRLKSELKKKGDILDKMQKLVQPMTENHSHNSSRSMELTGHPENCARDSSNDRFRKIPVCSMEGTSFTMCNTAIHQEVQCTEVQPEIEATIQVVHQCNVKQSSFSSKNLAAGADSLHTQKKTCSSNGALQNSQCSARLLEEDLLSRKTDGGGDFVVNDRVELSGHVEGSNRIESHDANLVEDKPLEQMHDTQPFLNTECLDEKGAVLAVCEKNADYKDMFQGSTAAVRGFYVRRKVRENGKVQEKKNSNMADENVVLEHDTKTSVLIRSSSETVSMLKTDASGAEHQTSASRRDSQALQDATDSSNLLEHVVQLRGNLTTKLCEDLASDAPEEISSSEISRGIDLGSSTTRGDVVVENIEFARPDYEVATSLAELASIGLEVRSRELETLPRIGSKDSIFLKPGRTGLRMKRKGISFERRVTLQQSDGQGNKKLKTEKLDSRLTDGNTERVLRRNRGGKYSTLKDSLSLESSRDNRRLMQGARQLLCLAEKKWR